MRVLPKWTRLVKPIIREPLQNPSITRCYGKRSLEQVEFLLDLPRKRLQVLKIGDGTPLGGGWGSTTPITMNRLIWNCHELGNLRTGKELVEIIREKDPSVVFIVETWADEARLDQVQ